MMDIKNEIPNNLKIAFCSLKERVKRLDTIEESKIGNSQSKVLGKKNKLNPKQVVARFYRNKIIKDISCK